MRGNLFAVAVDLVVLTVLCVGQLAVYARMPLPPEGGGRSIKAVDRSFLKVRRFWLGAAMLLKRHALNG